MKNKKILFFIGGSYVSGLEIVTLHLLRGLKENGYTVECIINGWNNGDFKKRLTDLNIPSHELKLGWFYIKKPTWTIDSLIHYPKAYLQCRKIYNKFKPDICHFCNFSNPILIYPLIKNKSVFNLQESLLPTVKHLFIFKLLNKKISAFTAVSKHIVNILENLNIPADKIKLVYNGIPHLPITYNNKNTNTIHIGIVGQVAEWKGHHTLIAAAEELVKNGISNFKILIYGNDTTPYGSKMKKKIKEDKMESYISWMGFVRDQEMIYSNCDIVVIPTLTGEPCSLTIIESMFHRKAIIASDRGGNPELIMNNKTGFIFKGDDYKELSGCLKKFIDSKDLREELADNAYAAATKNNDYLNMTDQYIEIYEGLK